MSLSALFLPSSCRTTINTLYSVAVRLCGQQWSNNPLPAVKQIARQIYADGQLAKGGPRPSRGFPAADRKSTQVPVRQLTGREVSKVL